MDVLIAIADVLLTIFIIMLIGPAIIIGCRLFFFFDDLIDRLLSRRRRSQTDDAAGAGRPEYN